MGIDHHASEPPAVRVLGPVRIFGSRPLAGRQAALVVALTLAAPHSVGSDELATLIFGDEGNVRRDEVRVLVSRLRRVLRVGPGAPSVRHDACGYALVGATTDVAAFDQLAAQAMDAAERGEMSAGGALARAALDLWPDSVVPAPLSEHPALVRLMERRLGMLQVWFRSEMHVGHHERVLPELLLACQTHPYAEELWQTGMVALYRTDRQVDALALYQQIRRTLINDLGVEPGAGLRETERGVLTHELDDIPARPHTGEPPPPSWRGFPMFHDRYVSDGGSAEALRLACDAARHIPVPGPAGVGKTRLVVEALATSGGQWTDGAAFCSLSSVDGPVAVVAAVAGALGTRIPAGADAMSAIVGDLADRRFLLVLDTCEHVAAAAAALSDELRRRCDAVTIVATSRSPLRVDHEVVVDVVGLEPATAGVALFVDRAGRATPGQSVADDERLTIEAICARLDGLPLAIELAAARSRTFSPSELADRLDRRLAILRSTSG